MTSKESEGSSDTLASLERPTRRLGDMPLDKMASCYGKWESTETLDTADVSDVSEDHRPHLQQTALSLRLDAKIEAKKNEVGVDRDIEAKSFDAVNKQKRWHRTKLSLLLDEKIEAKLRREAKEGD